MTGTVVLFTHFIVVNRRRDRVTVFQPGNGSNTTFDGKDGKLSLVEPGRQAATRLTVLARTS